jgi:transposase
MDAVGQKLCLMEGAKGKTTIVTYTNGQWFASVRQEQAVPKQAKARTSLCSVVALDPGVRTFQTAFSYQDATQYGDKFVETKWVHLMLGLDHLLSLRDKLLNEDKSKQWVQDRLKYCKSLIHKIRAKHQN